MPGLIPRRKFDLKHVEMRIKPKEQGVGIAFSNPHHTLAQKLATLHRTQREDTTAKRWERRASE
ncbi:hypothetical protein ASF28_09365 [Methylobacterium sp. Leaf99]|nr:hypothetical protein ASF28_09365 [Methylobacterium sp. Leaf99]